MCANPWGRMRMKGEELRREDKDGRIRCKWTG
jgi:hypothetical protein